MGRTSEKVRKYSQYRSKAPFKRNKKRVLIFCEAEKTEYYYFKSFPQAFRPRIESLHGLNSCDIVKQAVKKWNGMTMKGDEFDQVWCVFDRDKNTTERLHEAFDVAQKEGILVAYSSIAFELWILLHFTESSLNVNQAKDYQNLIDKHYKKHTGRKYDKTSDQIYNDLRELQEKAIKRAEKLYPAPSHQIDLKNTSTYTSVHMLVKKLIS